VSDQPVQPDGVEEPRSEAEDQAGDVGASTAEPGGAVLRVADLTRSFGAVSVLEGASFEQQAGTVTAVVGPNGSGKTTLLRVVAGLLPPDEGRVTVEGGAGRRLGYLPQEPSFRSSFTVAETLAFYGDLLGPLNDVDEALARVGLAGVADRRVGALSGGMRRLLGVAVATLGDPDLVVLDEPTGDLDPRVTDTIFGLVDDLATDGTAVLLATHDLSGAAGADRVLVLDDGGFVARGDPAEVLATVEADSLAAAFRALVETEVGPGTGVDG
jgi:ABC-type multidrug transport system ATPase subunit